MACELDTDVVGFRRRKCGLRTISGGVCGEGQIFQSAAQADPEFAVAGVDGGEAAREVGENMDRVAQHGEFPGLRIMPTRRERRIADDLPHLGRHGGPGAKGSGPDALLLFAVIQPGRVSQQCLAQHGGYSDGSDNPNELSAGERGGLRNGCLRVFHEAFSRIRKRAIGLRPMGRIS